MFYRKKPVVIQAVQWTGENRDEIFKFCSECHFNVDFHTVKANLIIRTLEGDMQASVNDYVIKGVNGEFYACKPDVFKKTYEFVTDH
jgi:hypothetical protein